jgi:hypothetical protein
MSVRQNPPKWPSNPQCFPAQIRNIGQTVSHVTYVTSRVHSQSVTKYYNFLLLAKAQTHEIDDTDDCVDSPIFSCIRGKSHLHTHLPADQVLYHLGKAPFTTTGFSKLTLTEDAEQHWLSLTSSPKVREVLGNLPKIKIPGGKMSNA